MSIISGIAVIILAAVIAVWCNDHLSVGDYITDEQSPPILPAPAREEKELQLAAK